MNFLKRAAFKFLINRAILERQEFSKYMFSNGITGMSFDTDNGPIIIPTNSRSIIESFLAGKYFGSDTLAAFLACGRNARRLLNIGANVGSSARMIAATGIYDRIDCFEPEPSNYSFLRLNSALNPSIFPHNEALGSEVCELQLNLNPKSIGRHSFKMAFGGGSIAVSVRRVDDVVAPTEQFDIFMDVEGWEIEVLQGARSTLRNCGICCLEWNGQMHSLSERKAALELLSAAGFNTVQRLDIAAAGHRCLSNMLSADFMRRL